MSLKFKVVKATAAGNLLLEVEGQQPEGLAAEVPKLDGRMLYSDGRKAAVIIDAIANVKKPFFLAKPAAQRSAGEFIGARLSLKK